jgi:hypothetical protein
MNATPATVEIEHYRDEHQNWKSGCPIFEWHCTSQKLC